MGSDTRLHNTTVGSHRDDCVYLWDGIPASLSGPSAWIRDAVGDFYPMAGRFDRLHPVGLLAVSKRMRNPDKRKGGWGVNDDIRQAEIEAVRRRAAIDDALLRIRHAHSWEIHFRNTTCTFVMHDDGENPAFKFEMGRHDALNVIEQVESNLRRIRP